MVILEEDIYRKKKDQGREEQVRSHRSFIESKALSSEGTQRVGPSTYVAEALTGHLNAL